MTDWYVSDWVVTSTMCSSVHTQFQRQRCCYNFDAVCTEHYFNSCRVFTMQSVRGIR